MAEIKAKLDAMKLAGSSQGATIKADASSSSTAPTGPNNSRAPRKRKQWTKLDIGDKRGKGKAGEEKTEETTQYDPALIFSRHRIY